MTIAIDFVGTNLGSGSKTYSINFCNELNSLKLKKKLTVFMCKNYYLELDDKIKKNQKIKFILKPNFFRIAIVRILWMQLIFPFELKSLQIKKLYSSLNFSPILANLFNIKVVLCCHTNLPWVNLNFLPGNKIKNYFIKKLMELSIYTCHILIVNSYYAKRELIKLVQIENSKIKVVYLGINKKDFIEKKNKNSLLENFNYKNKYILSVISCTKYHNIINLLKAFKKLIADINFPIKFVFVMQVLDKKYFKDINNYIKNNFEKSCIILLSNLSKKKITYLYKKAQLYVFTSYSEVFGLTSLEAMACKLPVVISNTSALKEVNNNACLYFHPDNVNQIKKKFKILLMNKDLKNKLIKRGLKNLKRFNLKKNISKTMKILDQLN